MFIEENQECLSKGALKLDFNNYFFLCEWDAHLQFFHVVVGAI